MKIGSLFSGIGGLELGLEWAGVGHTVFQVERDPYCRAVLAKHWPHATRYDDVCTVGAHNLEPVDVICGGFPCQDISHSGTGDGIAIGTRSGLWYEFARIIDETRPSWVVIENSAALTSPSHYRSLNIVLGDLRSLGYRGERSIVSACTVGAPHMRDRLFVVAYATRERLEEPRRMGERRSSEAPRHRQADHAVDARGWPVEPDVARVAPGLRNRVDRVRALGNSVVPQVAEVVGRRLLEIDATLTRERAA